MNQSGPLHLNYTLSRAEFEKITRDLLERCKACLLYTSRCV